MSPDGSPTRVSPVVLLDALGTLVALEDPGPHLRDELARRGVTVDAARARAAMRAEIAFYRAEHHRAGTPEGLARLRRACAVVVRDALGGVVERLPIGEVEAALLAAIRFVAYPEVAGVLAALRADGARLVVLSNWDVSLHEVLARTGLAGLVDGALSSAEAGVAKPDPEVFVRALALVGGRVDDALMVGDSLETDVAGAQAAGITPVLVLRGGGAAPEGVAGIDDLGGLRALVRYLR